MPEIPITQRCSGMCAKHCNSLLSGPEIDRLEFLLEADAQAHEAATRMRAVTEPEKEVMARDAELLRRLIAEIRK